MPGQLQSMGLQRVGRDLAIEHNNGVIAKEYKCIWRHSLSLPDYCFQIVPLLPPPLPGLSSNVVPMYLGELAPKNWTGALGVVPQLFITIGILVAQIFGLRSLLANEEGEFGMPSDH